MPFSALGGNQVQWTINQGETEIIPITWTDVNNNPVDITGYSAKLQIRPYPGSSDVLLTLQTSDSTITLGDTNGIVTLHLSSALTAALSFKGAFFDLLMTSASAISTRMLQGPVVLNEQVTI